MVPGLEINGLNRMMKATVQNSISKVLHHFDESGAAARLQGGAANLAALARVNAPGGNGPPGDHLTPGGRQLEVPWPDGDNRVAADRLAQCGVSDDVLIRIFQPDAGLAFSVQGQTVLVGRGHRGEARNLARFEPETGNFSVLPGSDPAFGFHMRGDTDRVVIFDNPAEMLRHASESSEGRRAGTEPHRYCLTHEKELSLKTFFERNPEIRQAEYRVEFGAPDKLQTAIGPITGGVNMETAVGDMERVSFAGILALKDSEPALLPNGRSAMVSGEPHLTAKAMEAYQGRNSLGFRGTCGLVSSRNVMRLFGVNTSENELVHYAVRRGLCLVDRKPEYSGATNALNRQRILGEWGFPSEVVRNPTTDIIAARFEAGHGVMVSVNAGILWDNANYFGNGHSNHVVTITGTARNDQGNLLGFYICDSGRRNPQDAARYISVDRWRDAISVPGSAANVTGFSRKEGE